MIRSAILSDIGVLANTALEMAEIAYPLKPDEDKIRKCLIEVISSAKHFALISENEQGHVIGCLIAVTSENMWAQRQCSQIVMWLSNIRGEGAKMLIQFREWIRSRRAIKVAGLMPDSDAIDPRALRLAERLGFKKHGGAYLLYN